MDGGRPDAQAEAGPLDAALVEAGLDARAPDARPPDARPPDAQLTDAGLFDDTEIGQHFAELPDRACIPGLPLYEPPTTDTFEVVHEVTGRPVRFVADLDGDGRSELFRQVGFDPLISVSPHPGTQRSLLFEVETWRDGAFEVEGRFRGMIPLAHGDLDGDGVPELVGCGSGPPPQGDQQFWAETLDVRRSTNDSEFVYDTVIESVHRQEYPGARAVYQAFMVDSDVDGRMELLTGPFGQRFEWTDNGFRQADGRVAHLHINRRGGASGEFDDSGFQVAAGYLDGDEHLDFITSGLGPYGEDDDGPFGRYAVRVWEVVADDQYRLKFQSAIGLQHSFTAVGNYDGDGRGDFLLGGSGAGCYSYSIFTANGDDQYRRVWTLTVYIPFPGAVFYPSAFRPNATFADTDGDGRQELILGLGPVLSIYEWDGMTFQHLFSARHCQFCETPEVFAADLEGDGRQEVIVSYRDISYDYDVFSAESYLPGYTTWIYRRREMAGP